LRDPTAAAFVIDTPDLRRAGATAADALAYVPGVEVTRTGGGADLATASLRGATSAQTPVYLAGIRLNDDLTGTADLATLPLWLLRRIEVDRGNAPGDADQLGIGGAIFFEPQLPNGTHARLMLGAGSFGAREARAAVSLGDERAAAVLAIRHATARDDYPFVDDRGTRFDDGDDRIVRRVNADWQHSDAWAIARWYGKRIRVRALVNSVWRRGGAPGLQIIAARHTRAELYRTIAGIAGETSCGGRGCCIDWTVDGMSTRYRLDDPARELGLATLTENAGTRTRQRVRLRGRIVPWLELAGGASQELQHLSVAQDGLEQVARRQGLRADLEGRAALGDRARVVAIAAIECHSTGSSAGLRACSELAPAARLGARVRVVGPLEAFANVGRYVRVPTLGELYGISSVLQGNPELVAERGVSLDAGLAVGGRRGSIEGYAQLDGFVRWSDRLIAFRRSSFGAARPYNVGSARVLGMEAALGVRAWRWLGASLALTLLDPRDTSSDRQTQNDLLPFRSRATVAPMLEVSSPPWRTIALDGAALSVRYLYRSSRVVDPAGLVVLPESGQLDLDVDARFHGHLVARARVSNVLDQRVVDVLGYPLPGRAAHASVEIEW
jgi:iron complex outermembrane receptor protein